MTNITYQIVASTVCKHWVMTLLEASLLTNMLVNISKPITSFLSGTQHHKFLLHFHHSTSSRRDYWFRSMWVTIHNCMSIFVLQRKSRKQVLFQSKVSLLSMGFLHYPLHIWNMHCQEQRGLSLFTAQRGFY